jgi:hypothetical protein
MSKLYDTIQKDALKDFALIEKLFWQSQAGKMDDYTLLSYPGYGLYVHRVINSENGFIRVNGKDTDRKIAHFAQVLSETEEKTAVNVGLRSGRTWDSDGKAQTPKPSTGRETVDIFDAILALHPAQGNANSTNSWVRNWHVALACRLGLLSRYDESHFRSEAKLGDTRKFNFCVRNCAQLNPVMLRKAWQEANKPNESATTPKKSNVDKVEPVQESGSTTAIAQAMEDKAS